MSASQDPNLGLFYGWSFRESGWKTGMDSNLLRVGALLHLSVKSRSTTAPPGSPSAGDRYWIPTGGTGAWAGHDHSVAVYRSGAWSFEAIAKGVLAYDESDGATYSYTGSTWTAIGTGGSGYLTTANTGLVPLTGAVQLPQYGSGTYPSLTDADCGSIGWDADFHGLLCWTNETDAWSVFPVAGQLQVLGGHGITIVDSLRWNIGTTGAFASLIIKPEGSSAGMRMLGDGTFISDNIDGDPFLGIYPSDSAGLWGFDMIHPMTLSAGFLRLRKGTIYDPHDVLTIDNKGKVIATGSITAPEFVGDLTGTASGNALLEANVFTASQTVPDANGILFASADLGLSRSAAGVLKLTDGSTGEGSLLAGAIVAEAAGAASTPGLLVSGQPFIGTGTTSFPQLLLQEGAGTAPRTDWNSTASTGGTYLGINARDGFTGSLVDLGTGGVSRFDINHFGYVTGNRFTSRYHMEVGSTLWFGASGNAALQGPATGTLRLHNSSQDATANQMLQFYTDAGVARLGAGSLLITDGTLTGAGKAMAAQWNVSAMATAPASASDTGTLGEVRVTATHIYVCTATDTWVRAALSTWS